MLLSERLKHNFERLGLAKRIIAIIPIYIADWINTTVISEAYLHQL
jgi:hypothetical protein